MRVPSTSTQSRVVVAGERPSGVTDWTSARRGNSLTEASEVPESELIVSTAATVINNKAGTADKSRLFVVVMVMNPRYVFTLLSHRSVNLCYLREKLGTLYKNFTNFGRDYPGTQRVVVTTKHDIHNRKPRIIPILFHALSVTHSTVHHEFVAQRKRNPCCEAAECSGS